MRLRRSRGLVCYWHAGSFIAHAYPHGAPTALHPAATEVLSAFGDWTDPAEVNKALEHLTAETVDEAVEALREAGLLLAEDTEQASRDDRFARQWGPWDPEASFFHYATQDVPYPDEEAQAQETEQESPALFELFTEYSEADRIFLPRPLSTDLRAPYDQVLHGRRTHRDFTEDPVPLSTLATLLSTTFGPTDFVDCGRCALFRRTSPAGGARQELDAYLAIRNVAGVEPGTYHYNLREHSLELLSEGFTSEEGAHLCADQDWAGGAAFLVVLSAVVDRMLSKYPTPRCYRVVLINAGHLGQTFALTATALGLGPAQTGAFHDTPVADRLGLDNVGRIPLYVLAAGYPHPEPQDAPPPAELDTFRRTTLNG
ncbi:SagB-type dehydrogenase family enzyme [Saccharopolyspora lacisalsi]|uniref:SagB-type dehydrogenase family enzyme n=1 Tax=Halosaccharopolyspora lacisalsi TaxID=1000566 RepID=A0A839DW58_9PSEU|nr:SagB/ThcOx family dehydrogenase [Halosaccharopolyspora lacisalsi]MBA8825130.1 SagB-type dehydrogenase family enzyme [Halosaccharopolyspora lacisalsi]